MPSAESTPASVHESEPVRPTKDDEISRNGSEFIGGPLGRRALLGTSWWTPVRVIALVAIGLFALGLVQKAPCYNGGWFFGASSQYTHACYSDIPHLYQGRGFADGLVPYFDKLPGDMQYLEYPVLTGVFMEVAAWLTPGSGSIQDQEQWYWMVNAGMLMVCAAIIVVCVSRTHARRPWDGLLVALAPAFALTATINWDLLAVALTASAMLMWARGRSLAFGVLLGLATAAKLYPVFLLGALFVLCWRAGKWRDFGKALGGTVVSWLVVNLPVMFFAFDGWSKFYTFSQERGVDFGSFWLIIAQNSSDPLSTDTVNTLATSLMLLSCAGIAALTLTAPHAAAVRPARVPDRRRVHPHQQGLFAAVRTVVGAAGRAGQAEVAGLPHLAGVRGGVLPGDLDVPRVHDQRRCPQGTADRRLSLGHRPASDGHGVPLRDGPARHPHAGTGRGAAGR